LNHPVLSDLLSRTLKDHMPLAENVCEVANRESEMVEIET
jgi:hypothetical protein